MLVNHHFWAYMNVRWWLCMQTRCPLPVCSYNVLRVLGAARDESGSVEGAFPTANDSVQVRLRAQRSTATRHCSGRRRLRMRT